MAVAELKGRIFLDTNVLVYAYDTRDAAKLSTARALLADDRLDPVVSAQVLGEFYVTMTRKLNAGFSESEVGDLVELLSDLHVVPLTRNLVLRATETSAASQLSYWDALVIEAASAAGAGVLVSEDLQHGSVVNGVTIVNPFLDD